MSSYSIVDIPGWEQISLSAADEHASSHRIAELAHQTVPDDVPRDTATPFREEVRKQLERVAASARASGAGMICIPVERTGGHPVPAIYTVGEWSGGGAAAVTPDDLVQALASAADGLASVTFVDGQPALREETIVPADPAVEPLAAHAARRVVYTIAAPDPSGSWVIFTFATLGNGDPNGPLARVLVDLFDAHIGTLRWTSV